MPLSVKIIAVLLTTAHTFIVAGLYLHGRYLAAAGLACFAIVGIGCGVFGQTPSGRTKSTSA